MAFNSTIISKKRKLACGCFDYAFSKNRCKQCATIQSTNKRIEKHEEGIEDESRQNLIQDLDTFFSRYIRIKYADVKGIVSCYTCGTKSRWKEIQNGHYISRKNLATRWLDEDCRPQCEVCNCHKHGNLEVFKANLEKEHKGITSYLEEQARQVYKPTLDELKQLLIEIKFKLKTVQAKFNK